MISLGTYIEHRRISHFVQCQDWHHTHNVYIYIYYIYIHTHIHVYMCNCARSTQTSLQQKHEALEIELTTFAQKATWLRFPSILAFKSFWIWWNALISPSYPRHRQALFGGIVCFFLPSLFSRWFLCFTMYMSCFHASQVLFVCFFLVLSSNFQEPDEGKI